MYNICLYLYICIDINIYLLVLSQIAGNRRATGCFRCPDFSAFERAFDISTATVAYVFLKC